MCCPSCPLPGEIEGSGFTRTGGDCLALTAFATPGVVPGSRSSLSPKLWRRSWTWLLPLQRPALRHHRGLVRGVANFSQVHIGEPVHEANEVLAVRCRHREQGAPQSLIVALAVLRLSPRQGLRTADTKPKRKTFTLGPRSSAAEDAFLRTEATDLKANERTVLSKTAQCLYACHYLHTCKTPQDGVRGSSQYYGERSDRLLAQLQTRGGRSSTAGGKPEDNKAPCQITQRTHAGSDLRMLQQAIGLCLVQQCNSNHALCKCSKSWRLERAGLQNVAMHAAAVCWSCDYEAYGRFPQGLCLSEETFCVMRSGCWCDMQGTFLCAL